jgi:vitamin B12/bleomycin/antimicrobial peptide transport system ATP-binding/permease protein
LAGAYFSGRFQLGEFTQAAYAFSGLQSSLSLVVDQFQALTDYVSVVNCLAAFEERCEMASSEPTNDRIQIEVAEDASRIELEKLTLMTPDYSRALQSDLSPKVVSCRQ